MIYVGNIDTVKEKNILMSRLSQQLTLSNRQNNAITNTHTHSLSITHLHLHAHMHTHAHTHTHTHTHTHKRFKREFVRQKLNFVSQDKSKPLKHNDVEG